VELGNVHQGEGEFDICLDGSSATSTCDSGTGV